MENLRALLKPDTIDADFTQSLVGIDGQPLNPHTLRSAAGSDDAAVTRAPRRTLAFPEPRGHRRHPRGHGGPVSPAAGSSQRVPRAVCRDVGLP
eukprot:91509-Pyramimonas_sp.AAC.1